MPDTPTRPLRSDPSRPRARGLLLGIGGAVVVLGVVFGVVTARHRDAYQAYRAETLQPEALPWQTTPMSAGECVQWATEWGLQCPGVESWCLGDAPRVTLMCLAKADRRTQCAAFGDEVRTHRFGYAECEAMREDVDGRYAKRGHKKYCAANYRAVAEWCQGHAEAPVAPAP